MAEIIVGRKKIVKSKNQKLSMNAGEVIIKQESDQPEEKKDSLFGFETIYVVKKGDFKFWAYKKSGRFPSIAFSMNDGEDVVFSYNLKGDQTFFYTPKLKSKILSLTIEASTIKDRFPFIAASLSKKFSFKNDRILLEPKLSFSILQGKYQAIALNAAINDLKGFNFSCSLSSRIAYEPIVFMLEKPKMYKFEGKYEASKNMKTIKYTHFINSLESSVALSAGTMFNSCKFMLANEKRYGYILLQKNDGLISKELSYGQEINDKMAFNCWCSKVDKKYVMGIQVNITMD